MHQNTAPSPRIDLLVLIGERCRALTTLQASTLTAPGQMVGLERLAIYTKLTSRLNRFGWTRLVCQLASECVGKQGKCLISNVSACMCNYGNHFILGAKLICTNAFFNVRPIEDVAEAGTDETSAHIPQANCSLQPGDLGRGKSAYTELTSPRDVCTFRMSSASVALLAKVRHATKAQIGQLPVASTDHRQAANHFGGDGESGELGREHRAEVIDWSFMQQSRANNERACS